MTIPKACKRLAEVHFPIAVFSKHSAREKSIRLNFIRGGRGGCLRIFRRLAVGQRMTGPPILPADSTRHRLGKGDHSGYTIQGIGVIPAFQGLVVPLR